MVQFNPIWYKNFIQHTNEKNLLVDKIGNLLEGKPKNSCLEIGLGLSPYFANRLSKLFKRYIIIEKELYKEKLPKGVKLIQNNWEKINLNEKFDVIIASHVMYYFKNPQKSFEKMISHLNKKGRVYLVVNGDMSDYGPLKLNFAKMIKTKYYFTYDKVKKIFKNCDYKEYTLPSVMNFKSYESLFNTLRLSFDTYPNEYEKMKDKIIEYFKNNVKGDKFIIDQKIFEITK